MALDVSSAHPVGTSTVQPLTIAGVTSSSATAQSVPMHSAQPVSTDSMAKVGKTETPTDAKLVTTAIIQGMMNPLWRTTAACVEAWQAPDFEMAAWPFRVQREFKRLEPQAHAQTRSNHNRVLREVSSRVAVLDLLKDGLAESGYNYTDALNENHPLAETVRRSLQAGADIAGFQYYGTLFVMGWGAGDHEAPKAYVPSGPKTAAASILNRVKPEMLEAEVAKALEAGVITKKAA